MRPVNYITGGVTLGHYAVTQKSGLLTGTIAAAGIMASIRWSDPTRFLALMRVKAGWMVTTVTNQVSPVFDLAATIVRGFTVDFTVGTAISMTGVTNTNKTRASMGASLMGAAGPRIATTVVMSGQTATLDAAPFAVQTFPMLINTSAGGVGTGVLAGTGTGMQTLYEWTGLGQHPPVLAANEGVILSQVTGTVFGSGVYALYTQWEWAEVAVF